MKRRTAAALWPKKNLALENIEITQVYDRVRFCGDFAAAAVQSLHWVVLQLAGPEIMAILADIYWARFATC